MAVAVAVGVVSSNRRSVAFLSGGDGLTSASWWLTLLMIGVVVLVIATSAVVDVIDDTTPIMNKTRNATIVDITLDLLEAVLSNTIC